MKIRSAYSSRGRSINTAIVGPPGVGKTVCAASASVHFPHGKYPRRKRSTDPMPELVTLSDVLHIGFDDGACEPLTADMIDLPSVDFQEYLADSASAGTHGPNPEKALALLMRDVRKYVAETPECKIVIADTLTSLDRTLVTYYGNVWSGHARELQKQYGDVLRVHRKFHTDLKALGVRIVYCVHSKAAFIEDGANKQKQEQQAKAVSADVNMPTIVPAISGQSSTMYIGDCALELFMRRKQDPRTKQLSYMVATVTTNDGCEAKTRYPVLDDSEPANLAGIFEKIGFPMQEAELPVKP